MVYVSAQRIGRHSHLFTAVNLMRRWYSFFVSKDESLGHPPGQINKIEVPYLVKIENFSSIGQGARGVAQDFVQLIKELHNSGCPVNIEVQD